MVKFGQCWWLMKFGNVCNLWYWWMNFDLNFAGIEIMKIWCVGLIEQIHFWWVRKICWNVEVLSHGYGNFYGYRYGYGKSFVVIWIFMLDMGFFLVLYMGFFCWILFYFLVEFWNEYFGTWYFVRMSILGHGVLWASRWLAKLGFAKPQESR